MKEMLFYLKQFCRLGWCYLPILVLEGISNSEIFFACFVVVEINFPEYLLLMEPGQSTNESLAP